jgi:rubrerythrin
MKDFSELTERELLALAIALEEEDSRIYEEFAEGLREPYPDTSRMFTEMSAEEDGHRHRLLDLYRNKFGDHLPLIRRQDVRGFIQRKPVWLSRPLGLEKVREQAELMEAESKRFYARAAGRSQDAAIRQLLGDLAAEERRHEAKAEQLEAALITPEVRKSEHEAERRLFLLQVIQPDGRLGLDPGAALCRGLRDAPDLVDLPRRPRRLSGRRHQHGLRRGFSPTTARSPGAAILGYAAPRAAS